MALEVESGKEFRRNPAAAFVFIGLDPNPQFPQETVAREDIGFITADGMFQASVRGCSQPAICGRAPPSSWGRRSGMGWQRCWRCGGTCRNPTIWLRAPEPTAAEVEGWG